MDLLARLLKSSKSKVDTSREGALKKIKEDLKAVLYDDALVDELLPTFESLYGHEGFEKVMELLTTKEKQIEAISGGNYFKKESGDLEGEVSGDQEEEDSDASEDPLVKMIEDRVNPK